MSPPPHRNCVGKQELNWKVRMQISVCLIVGIDHARDKEVVTNDVVKIHVDEESECFDESELEIDIGKDIVDD